MYSNGRITIFYEDIPTGIDSNDLISEMSLYETIYDNHELLNSIRVPKRMIRTGTVVHLTPAQKYCSKETSNQACIDGSSPDVVCYWCDGSSVCTSTFDQYTEIWLENHCVIAVMGEDHKGDSSSSTSNLNPTETTSTSPETSNQQLEATTYSTDGSQQNAMY
uniref:SJCHGC06925 protein n=1 Tax=Schistosoma japonicum TaxID=6182 RepID=Q5DAN0_SCHJA|nr:SJCHGC06925 protein [Schistosoma japonicum]